MASKQRPPRASTFTDYGIAAVSNVLRAYPLPLTIAGIAEETGLPDNTVGSLVSQMLKRGVIEVCDTISILDDGVTKSYSCFRLSNL